MFQLLECFFSKCSDFNLKLNSAKTLLFKSKVDFLGSEISDIGIRPVESKLKIVRNMMSPDKAAKPYDHLSFVLGFLSFMRKHIPNFAELLHLYTLSCLKNCFSGQN